MGKDSIMRNLALLNTLWDGKSLTVDRRSAPSFAVNGGRLTVGLMIQADTLRTFLDSSGTLARGSGFLARFLIAWPESNMGNRPFKESKPSAALAAFHRRVTEILEQPAPVSKDGSLSPAMLTLSPLAFDSWRNFHDRIESEMGKHGEYADVQDVAAKSADNAARIAAVFHAIEGSTGPISRDTFERAAQVAEWHLYEARRFFGELALPAELANAMRLDAWLVSYCRRSGTHLVPKRDAQRLGPVRDRAALDAAVSTLAELDRAQERADAKRKFIAVNPALLRFATATPATPATHGGDPGGTVASVATVNVAIPAEPVPVEGEL